MRHVARCGFLVAAVVALAAWMTPASAAPTFGGELFGAYNSYAMTDVNEQIQLANQNDGSTFDELSGSFTGGLGLRTWANTNWLFSASWEPLPSKTESGTTTLDMNANSFQVNGAYFFPSSSTKARYGIGAGLGYYLLNGKIEDTGSTEDIGGNGVGFQVFGLSEWQVSPGFAVTGTAGYRNADFEIESENIAELHGRGATYSGFMGRVGMAFYLPTSSGN
jgi:hypothetical protein